MDDVTNLPPSRDPCLLWERICPTQKWYWPMKPFRRVRPGQVLPASQIDQDTGRQVEKALERQPLRSINLMSPKPISRLDFRCQRGLPITFNHDRILKFWKLACLCHCHFFTPRSLKNWGRSMGFVRLTNRTESIIMKLKINFKKGLIWRPSCLGH
jgi:hypothetical protein